MKSFQNLVVGIDLTPDGGDVSPAARRAVLQAQWLAERTGARLTLLHSTWDDLVSEGGVLRPGPSEEGLAALERLASDSDGTGVPTELVLSEERPWMALIHRVLAGQNDLVVVSRRSSGRHALGGVARKLLRKCPAPVWAVNPDHDLVHRLVFAATDLSPVGDEATQMAAYVAAAHGAELRVLHAWSRPIAVQLGSGRRPDGATADAEEDVEQTALRHIRADLARAESKPKVEIHLRCDSPVRFILGEVKKSDPDLVVLGTLSRGGVAGLLVGNTAEKLLDRLECSLLAVKPAGFVCPVELPPAQGALAP